VLTVFEGFLP